MKKDINEIIEDLPVGDLTMMEKSTIFDVICKLSNKSNENLGILLEIGTDLYLLGKREGILQYEAFKEDKQISKERYMRIKGKAKSF